MSRIELAKIPSLTFYKDSYTTSRRKSPLPQLVCRGAPCKVYTPEVVRCVSLPGASGTDVDWNCEADLPESLRFGRVEVSCEGWSRPGDPYVLKGSCSLEYRLVHVPSVLRNPDSPLSSLRSYDLSTIIFSILWVAFLVFILYGFFLSCFRRNAASQTHRPPLPPRPRPGSSSGGWFPGGMDDDYTPPPPYSKNPTGANEGWRPGFWTGAALGGIANHLFNRRQAETRPTTWDWEREQPRFPIFGGRRTAPPPTQPDDRGEGSSNLGAIRRSTGFGGSNVR
ncbi:Store-operated calcium entry-associated regulatory factor [Hypsizygus marmoreus]|uniref:Store-operated calcium entry-associated regulatory factor n=1 Tax=Hypsizygus marmoreus TaxID=39966 RepID=A0A369JV97_HYPMA|nr:Store-operated calcium entry-associated regulatory factor [Hypsizygus marmoreus]